MIIKAKCIGKSSLGFMCGTTYNLNIEENMFLNFIGPFKSPVLIETTAGIYPDYKRLRCQYDSLSIFLSLWKVEDIKYFNYSQLSPIIPYRSYEDIMNLFTKNIRDNKIEVILT